MSRSFAPPALQLHVPVRGDASSGAQWLAQGLPLTHFLRIVRGIVLKENGPRGIAGEVLLLGAILLALTTLTALRFRKKIV